MYTRLFPGPPRGGCRNILFFGGEGGVQSLLQKGLGRGSGINTDRFPK